MVTFTPRAGKWLLGLLVVSLGINLFLGSMILGRHFFRPHPDRFAERAERAVPAADRPLRNITQRMFAALPDNERPALEAALAEQRSALSQASRANREAREKVRDALAADPYDPAAVDRAFAELRTRTEEVQRAMHGAISSAAAKMTPEGRKRLADWNPEPERRRTPPGMSAPPGPPPSAPR